MYLTTLTPDSRIRSVKAAGPSANCPKIVSFLAISYTEVGVAFETPSSRRPYTLYAYSHLISSSELYPSLDYCGDDADGSDSDQPVRAFSDRGDRVMADPKRPIYLVRDRERNPASPEKKRRVSASSRVSRHSQVTRSLELNQSRLVRGLPEGTTLPYRAALYSYLLSWIRTR